MKFRRVFLIGAIATAGLTGLVFSIFPRARAMSHRHRGAVAQVHRGRHGFSQFCQHDNIASHIDRVGLTVERRLDLDADQTESLNQVKDSFNAFYTSLSPEQQNTLNEAFSSHRSHRSHREHSRAIRQ